MGKWKAKREIDGYFIDDGDVLVAKIWDKKTANEVCLMHNEGVELLKWIKDDIVPMAGPINKSPAKDYRDRITSLFKRMGVDCES